MQILGVLLALALIYAVMAGLGLTKGFKRSKNTIKTQMITDFEYPDDDLEWTTGGYVKMESSTDNKTHGKYSAKVSFLLESEFFPVPTQAAPAPGATPSAPTTAATPTSTWQPEIVLDTNSVSQLKVYEWEEYANLNMDAFNDQAQPVTYHVQIGDAHAYLYETSGPLTPKKVTNISIPLDEATKNRLDLSNIRSLRFWVDTAGAAQPVVVYLDNIRLEGDATAPKANPTPTPKK
jgi:hypothetical protein